MLLLQQPIASIWAFLFSPRIIEDVNANALLRQGNASSAPVSIVPQPPSAEFPPLLSGFQLAFKHHGPRAVCTSVAQDKAGGSDPDPSTRLATEAGTGPFPCPDQLLLPQTIVTSWQVSLRGAVVEWVHLIINAHLWRPFSSAQRRVWCRMGHDATVRRIGGRQGEKTERSKKEFAGG